LTPAEAARDAERVLICVGNMTMARRVYGAQGVFGGMRRHNLIDHTTTTATLAEDGRALADTAFRFSFSMPRFPWPGGGRAGP
jgi:3-hydroxyisobutyrate dehydrogenase-like beta-hydroxyacid dehydrogenase